MGTAVRATHSVRYAARIAARLAFWFIFRVKVTC